MSRILNEPRKLSPEELEKLHKATNKWYPQLIQTYNTTLYEMMASPLKKSLVHTLVIVVLVGILLVVNKTMKLKFKLNNLIYIGIVVVMVIVAGVTSVRQYRKNDNLYLFLTITNPNATKYDYESSSVIQSKLMRNALGSRGGMGSSMSGGILGGALGSMMTSRRRRR